MNRAIALGAALCGLVPSSARAYPWMIEHEYTSCAQCHVDPAGGSTLTAYGRAQGEILVRSHYKKDVGEPGAEKEFLYGVSLPEIIVAQIESRHMLIPDPSDVRYLLMQADLKLGVQTEKITVTGSIGIVSEGAVGARITKDLGVVEFVSREYWAGYRPKREWMIRGGRMNLPFGIRTDQHLLYTRSATRTDTNDDQQVGVSVNYETKGLRAEIMGIVGNFQISPDLFRERGYAGFVGWAPQQNLEIGLSSLATFAEADLASLEPRVRQAHGVFARWSPVKKFGLFAELNMLVDRGAAGEPFTAGFVGEVHADVEPVQGLHVRGGGEICDARFSDDNAVDSRGWLALQWFFLPHVNLRVDGLYGPLTCDSPAGAIPAVAAQLHIYL